VPLFSPPRSHVVDQEEDFRIAIEHRGEPGLLHARAWWALTGAPAVVVFHGIAGSKKGALLHARCRRAASSGLPRRAARHARRRREHRRRALALMRA
jgi:predicted alpha/beta-fold hydrolase